MDSHLIELTAKEAGCSTAEVKRALRIHQIYRKHKNLEKRERKRLRQEVLRKFELKSLKEKYPDRCFCEREGVTVRLDDSYIIRYEDGYSPLTGIIKNPIYRCSHCGKEYHFQVVIA